MSLLLSTAGRCFSMTGVRELRTLVDVVLRLIAFARSSRERLAKSRSGGKPKRSPPGGFGQGD